MSIGGFDHPRKLSQKKLWKGSKKDRLVPREHVARAGASILMKKPPAQFLESAQFIIGHIEEGVSVNGIRGDHEDWGGRDWADHERRHHEWRRLKSVCPLYTVGFFDLAEDKFCEVSTGPSISDRVELVCMPDRRNWTGQEWLWKIIFAIYICGFIGWPHRIECSDIKENMAFFHFETANKQLNLLSNGENVSKCAVNFAM
jgi:hypothetical protein